MVRTYKKKVDVKVKPYIGKSATPDFFENMKGFLKGVVKGVPQNELQGETKQLNLKEIENWSSIRGDLKERFSEWLLNKAEQEVGKKYPPGDLKGREKVMRTLEEQADMDYGTVMESTQKNLKEVKEEHRDEALRGARRRSEKITELSKNVAETGEDLESFEAELQALEESLEEEKQVMKYRRRHLKELGLTDEQVEKHRVLRSAEDVQDLREDLRG